MLVYFFARLLVLFWLKLRPSKPNCYNKILENIVFCCRFCTRHHPDYKPPSDAPPHLLLMLGLMAPHLVARLTYHLREAR